MKQKKMGSIRAQVQNLLVFFIGSNGSGMKKGSERIYQTNSMPKRLHDNVSAIA